MYIINFLLSVKSTIRLLILINEQSFIIIVAITHVLWLQKECRRTQTIKKVVSGTPICGASRRAHWFLATSLQVWTLEFCFACTIIIVNFILHRSELPSQVFFILLTWLQALITSGTVSADKLKSIYIAYDNMCNLCRLRVAKKPLPLPPPMDHAWLSVQKIIDTFHLKNHTWCMPH